MDKTRRSSIFNVHNFVILVNKFVLHGEKKRNHYGKKPTKRYINVKNWRISSKFSYGLLVNINYIYNDF